MPNPNRSKKMTDAMRNKRSRTREMKKYLRLQKASLNDEQIFINSLFERLTQYSMLSKAQFLINYYNPLAIINKINAQDENRTWIQSFFDSIWKCMQIPNQEYFFGTYLINKITQLTSNLDSLSSTGKTLTIEEFDNITAELMIRPLNSLNLLKEIMLFMFSYETCSIETDERIQMGGDFGIIVVVVFIIIVIYEKIQIANQTKSERNFRKFFDLPAYGKWY
jgi:hypothetical protein